MYQFASNHAAATVYAQIGAKYKSCKSVSSSSGQGGTSRQSVHSRVAERVGGHQSLLLTEFFTDSRAPGPPLVTVALWTLDGTDIYMVHSMLLNVHTPKPALSSLVIELIHRVRALR